jgi:hypothetical protein
VTVLVTNDKNLINKALISNIKSSMFDDFYLELIGIKDNQPTKKKKVIEGSSKDLITKTKQEKNKAVETVQDVELAEELDSSVVTNVVLIKKNKSYVSKMVSFKGAVKFRINSFQLISIHFYKINFNSLQFISIHFNFNSCIEMK